MDRRSRAADSFFILTFALTFYCVGAAFVEGFVNYRTWALIGPPEFQAYHQALSPRIIGTLVIPLAVQTLMSVTLIWFRPSVIPGAAILLATAFIGINWIITFLLQIPIQRQLYTNGYSLDLINKLISNDWIRKAFLVGDALLFLWMMRRVVANAGFRNNVVSVQEK